MSIRRFFVLALCLPCISLALPKEDTKVSFSAPADSADRLLKALGDKAGVPLRSTPTTSQDILLVSVKDVTLSALMNKIAEVENASWERDGEGYRLSRSDAQRRADVDRERANLANRYRDAILKAAKKAASLPEANGSYATGLIQRSRDVEKQMQSGNGYSQYQSIISQSPAGRLLTRLLPNLTPETLATVPEGGRVVVSDNPNKMQYRMPGNCASAIDAFIREQNLVATASTASPDDNSAMNFNISSAAIKTRPAKFILILQRRPFEGSLSCQLEVLDTQGHTLGRADQTIGESPFAELQPSKAPKPVDGEEPIKFSEETQALRNYFKSAMGGGGMGRGEAPALNPELRKKIADPRKYEPLSFAASEALLEYAKGQNANLVATLSDMTAVLNFPFFGDDLLPSSIPVVLRAADQSIGIKDGWMTVDSFAPATARKNQSDRTKLAQLLQAIVAKGLLTIDDAATYALARPGIEMDIFAMLWGTAIDASAINMFQQNGMSALRFYGGLTPYQRQLAANNAKIPFSTLASSQKDALYAMVYGPESRLNNQRAMSYEEGETPVYSSNESTEMLPNGIPPDGQFRFTIQTEPIVVPIRDGRSSMWQNGMTGRDLAWQMYAKDHPEVGGTWASSPENQVSLDALQLNERKSVQFLFEFTTAAGMEQTLRQMGGPGKKVAFADLPESFKKEFEEATKNYKDMKWGPGGPGGGGSPPPPRCGSSIGLTGRIRPISF